ncbi:hypothetical protein DAPPUDRAFT_334361 [Daphnia pulex]|uniref:Uncharacterized protein n=1 Tax=Daphnia pulex TaxID=6669 RepID=E9HVE6_DAPPU|nr:hypothetical protein DAPPUDRAFT_334361 [Daphnia pulex]|eukprot:EFX64278.1 hypothetical protein DAPPUDRAFT_334361 [Daphnia pulex]
MSSLAIGAADVLMEIIEIISPLLDGTASAYQFSKFLEEGFDLASQQHTPSCCKDAASYPANVEGMQSQSIIIN